MPSNYALAAQCQLFRDAISELFLLAAEGVATEVEQEGENRSGASSGNDTAQHSESFLPLWRAILTPSLVRSLIVRTLVRVSIPKNKQHQLLQSNKFIRAAGGPLDENGRGKQMSCYRVGTVMAVVANPLISSRTKPPASTGNEGGGGKYLSDWLLQINFGEVTELLMAKYVSNEPFTDEEHSIFVRSSMSAAINAKSTLLPADEADVVARNIRDIGLFVEAVKAQRRGATSRAEVDVTALHPRADAAGASRKRGRGEVGRVGEGVLDGQEAEGCVSDEEFTGQRGPSSADVSPRLVEELQRQLGALRQLLNSKNSDVQRLLQLQKKAADDHAAEQQQWKAKAEAQGLAIRRAEKALADERARQREHEEKTQRLVTQLKRLADQTRKFKEVSDTVAEWLQCSSRQPDEVLALVREKMK
ncbi:hypothetical protein ERJ75_001658900 [Trypanosoma vivax]|uniref:Uncharacterized protein n=1 Tax=Trypanosoma vivax (strain Y486) TaxID=1055687 RepID=G0U8C5_TRYVY|nr:hypothetical protein ERJ75_001658900 [Trypanosoma vivax]CCC53848.1 conserved hypothetical protein [Trypanosoma vivax Y486]